MDWTELEGCIRLFTASPVQSSPPAWMGEKPRLPYLTEFARSGRGKCRTCHKEIPCLALRVGVISAARGFVSKTWFHPQCFPYPKTLERVEDLQGCDSLTSQAVETLRQCLDVWRAGAADRKKRQGKKKKTIKKPTKKPKKGD